MPALLPKRKMLHDRRRGCLNVKKSDSARPIGEVRYVDHQGNEAIDTGWAECGSISVYCGAAFAVSPEVLEIAPRAV